MRNFQRRAIEAAEVHGGQPYGDVLRALVGWSDAHPTLRPVEHPGTQVVLKYALDTPQASGRLFWAAYPHQDKLTLHLLNIAPFTEVSAGAELRERLELIPGADAESLPADRPSVLRLDAIAHPAALRALEEVFSWALMRIANHASGPVESWPGESWPGASTDGRDGADEGGTGDSENWYSEAEYRQALLALEPRMSEPQRRMLVAHAESPDLMATVTQLAGAAGYESPSIVYAQYGRLGRMFAKALGHVPEERVWTRLMAVDTRTESNELLWTLEPALAQALLSLGWVSSGTQAEDFKIPPEVAEAPETVRKALLDSRIGQGRFREDLIRFWGVCAVTGVAHRAALRASHIKPWRLSSNAERLDVFNGLLLAAHLDALFDAGLITFASNGALLTSSLLADEDRKALGVHSKLRLRVVRPEHQRYLAIHREHQFRGSLSEET